MRSGGTSDIVISGAGLVTCLGTGVEGTWRAMLEGGCGIGPSTTLQSRPDPDLGYGEAYALPDAILPGMPVEVRSLRTAIDEAVAQAGLIDTNGHWRVPPERCGLVMGTTLHGMRSAGPYFRQHDAEALGSFLAGSTLRLAMQGLAVEGLAITTCAACASGLMSIAIARSMLLRGELDLVIAGGYDPVSEYAYGGFNSLRLIAAGPQRPFAKQRAGLKLAEGYAAVVLERAQSAHDAGRTALGRVLACSASADAHHLSQPHPDGVGAASAMSDALSAAALDPADIGLITAHATATPDNDRAEVAALRRVFGDRLDQAPITAMKSRLGHTLGAAGAVELILTLCALRDGRVPSVANVNAGDVEFEGIDVVTGQPRAINARRALINSLGFGGSNACAVVDIQAPGPQAPSEPVSSSPWVALGADDEPVITGVGVVYPGAVGNQAFVRLLEAGGTAARDLAAADLAEHLNARRARRLSSYVKLALSAASICCKDAGLDEPAAYPGMLSAVLGTMHGSAGFSESYYRQLVEEGVEHVNPLWFAEGVPNAGTAHLSMTLGLTGPCETLIGNRTAGLDAVRVAAARVAAGECDAVLVGAAEEFSEMVAQVYRRCGLQSDHAAATPFEDEHGFQCAAGAVGLLIESRASARARDARIYATVTGWSQAVWPSHKPKAAVKALSNALARLPAINHCLSSANGTWLDRIEVMAMRVAATQRGGGFEPAVACVSPRLHEAFSVSPLYGLAYALLTRSSPGLVGDALASVGGLRIAEQGEPLQAWASLASDYNGLSTSVSLLLESA